MEIAVWTAQMLPLSKRIADEFAKTGEIVEVFTAQPMDEWTKQQIDMRDALLCIGNIEDVVRQLAPFLADRIPMPGIAVLDEKAAFCVPLISGENDAAIELTRRISEVLGAVAVIPPKFTAPKGFDVKAWAESQNIAIENPDQIKMVDGKLSAGIGIKMLSLVEIAGEMPPLVRYTGSPAEADIVFSVYDFSETAPNALRLMAPVLSVGIGCRKGATCEQIEKAVFSVFDRSHIHFSAVRKVCTIDIKQNEPGLLQFCRKYDLKFEVFTAGQLSALKGNFRRGDSVPRASGVDNVCERAAVLGSGSKYQVLVPQTAQNGVTVAISANMKRIENYRFPE